MRNIIVALLLVFAAPAFADELDDYLDSLPPLSQEVRDAFTKAMMASYDEKCRCSVFLRADAEIIEAQIPLSDKSIRLMIEMLKRGLITPLITSKNET